MSFEKVEDRNLIVTFHALDRWRQRGAVYGDEKIQDVIRAVRASVAIDEKLVPRPFGRAGRDDKGKYFWHRESDGFFVCRRDKDHSEKWLVVTYFTRPVPLKPAVPTLVFSTELPHFKNSAERGTWLAEQRTLTTRGLRTATGEERQQLLAYLERLVEFSEEHKALKREERKARAASSFYARLKKETA